MAKPANILPSPPAPVTMGDVSAEWLSSQLVAIEARTGKDAIVIMGGIVPGLDASVRVALQHLQERRGALLVILDTPGGIVEVAERISDVLRHFYQTVDFLIINEAMSAGTILALSGDAIHMDYFSRLGPIDPQVERGGQLMPGLSYLYQYEVFVAKSEQGLLTEAELALLTKLDLAELHRIQLAAELSVALIQEWLPKYKFKDWTTHNDGTPVAMAEKVARAKEIATTLNDHRRWYSHAHGIGMETVRALKLQVDDFGKDQELSELLWRYYWVALEFQQANDMRHYAHTRRFI